MIDPNQMGGPPAMLDQGAPPAPPMGDPGAMGAGDPAAMGADASGQFPSLDPRTAIGAVMQMAQMDRAQFDQMMQQASMEFDQRQADALSMAAQAIQRMVANPPPETLNGPAGTESQALAGQGDPSAQMGGPQQGGY